MTQEKGFILHRSRSPFTNQNYVVILTTNSANRKTGNQCQVWILCEDIEPTRAVREGSDETICGDCKHRRNPETGHRTCYVNAGQAPTSVWRSYHAGKYVKLWTNELLEHAVRGRSIRWGAYGEPTLIPVKMVRWLNRIAKSHTGYTHQWHQDWAQEYKGVFMASVDTELEEFTARVDGWQTFRVMPKGETNPNLNIHQCSNAINPQIQCINCTLCNGNTSSIWINAHGPGAKHLALV